jgi:S-phase kinase-associated protein 1
MTSAESRTITLVSSDAKTFVVDVEIANDSLTLKNMIEDTGSENPIPIPNVTGAILSKIIEYSRYHKEADRVRDAEDGGPTRTEAEKTAWNLAFVDVDQPTLFELVLAANFLNFKSLLDMLCKTLAGMIRDKTPQEIRDTFNIKNDFTPEEEEAVRMENQWCIE